MLFWGQLACPDLALAKLTGLPDEGLLSLFVDTFEDAPQEARVYHLSWQQDLTTRTSPLGLSRTASFRPVFSTIPSLPHREHPDFRRLGLPSKTEAQYEQLLWDLEVCLRPCPVRCGGYPPYPFDSSLYPEEDPTDDWRFFLALGDLEELELSWPETGFALLWLPQDPSLQEPGRAELTWLPIWDDEDLEEDPEDEEL